MTTNQRGKLEISGAGIVLLGLATLVTTGIVFLLGIYVGKGMVEQRLQQESRVVRLPVPTPGSGGRPEDSDVTFWDKLGKGGEQPPVAAAPATPTLAPSAVRIAPGESRSVEPTARPAAPAPEKSSAHAAAEKPAPPPAAVAAKTGNEGATYQVQVNAMADKARADALVHDLESLGYRAFISSAKVGDKNLFRIRIGGLPSASAAKEAVARLREQGYPNAFVAVEVGE